MSQTPDTWRVIVIPQDPEKGIEEAWIPATLAGLQEQVGGNVESVPLRMTYNRVEVVPFFNEDGKGLELAPNERATRLLASAIFPGDYIAGDCILTGMDPRDGETVDCPVPLEVVLDKVAQAAREV